jgi:hypothetical protein
MAMSVACHEKPGFQDEPGFLPHTAGFQNYQA